MTAIHTFIMMLFLLFMTFNAQSDAYAKEATETATPALSEIGEQVADGWRRGKIETAYLLNPHLNPFDITVAVKGTHVHLSGKVSTEVEKELAHEIALATEGVESVRNDVQVEKNAAATNNDKRNKFVQAIKDATITATVKTRFITSQALNGFQISVDTENAQVRLSGTVTSEAEKALAERIAMNTNGVEKVDNQLSME